MIEKYELGILQVDGEEYHHDVIIYPEGAHIAPTPRFRDLLRRMNFLD